MALSFTDAFGPNARLLRTHNQGLSNHPFMVSTSGWEQENWNEELGQQVKRYQFNGPDAGTWTFNPKTSAFDFVPIGGDGKVTKSISGAELGLADPAYQIAGLATLAGKNNDSWSNYALTHNDYGGGVGSQQSVLAGAKDLRGAIGDINAYDNKVGWGDKLFDVGDDFMAHIPQAAALAAAIYTGGTMIDPSMFSAAGVGTGAAGTTAAGIELTPEMAALLEQGVTGSKAAADAYAASVASGAAGLIPSLSTVGTVGTLAPVVDATTVAVDPSGWVSDSAWQTAKTAAGAANTAHTATSLTDKVLNKIKDDPLGTVGKAATLGLGIKAATGIDQQGVSADESNLQAAQAKWLNNLNSIATPALRTGMGGLSKMTTQALDGTLGAQMRNQAGADANAALGTSANDALRAITSRGIGLDGNRGADTLGKWGIDAAKVRVGAMNQATNNAEDLKWGRAQNLTSLASGQGATANSGMSALTGQLASSRNAENAAKANAQVGMGQGLMYLAGKMFADGGEVIEGSATRVDMTPGGPVEGPGTETSDSIPAALSNGEFVSNATAVKLPRKVARPLVADWLKKGGSTKALLKSINAEGLRQRGDNPTAGVVATYGVRGQQQLAAGGLAMALGNMARGAVPVAMHMDQQEESARRWDAHNALAQAAEGRAVESFDAAKKDLASKEAKKQAVAGVMAKYQPLLAATGGDPRKALEVRQQQYAELSAIDPAYAAQVDNMLTTQLNTSLKDRDFTRQEGRDTVADQQWGQSFDQKDRQFNASHQVSLGNLNLSREKLSAEKADRDAKTAAALGVFSEHNPNASPAVLNAVKHGIIPAVPKSDDGAYKTEFSEVSSALGSPAVGEDGKPLLDVMTGRQVVNRNPDEERQFFAWAQQRGYKDTNKALPIYLAEKARSQPKSFASPADLEAAIKSGAVKKGDKVMTPNGPRTVN